MSGIFQNGIWTCGFDFLPNGAMTSANAAGVFDSIAGGSTGNVNASFAAFSGKGFQLAQGTAVGRSLGVQQQQLYMGFHWSTSGLPSSTNSILTCYDSVTGGTSGAQFNLGYNNSGQIGFYANGGQIVTTNIGNPSSPFQLSATGLIVPTSVYFVEVFLLVSSGAGQLIVRLNGATVATFSGATQKTANAFIDTIFLSNCASSGQNVTFDDIYMLDGTGTSPLNTFLGNIRIQTDGPNADSATGGLNAWSFTTPQGTDWGNAANIPPNPSDYNSAFVVGRRMSFKFPSLGSASRVFCMNTWFSAEQDAAGTRGITPVYRSNFVDQFGNPVALSNGVYVYGNQISTVDPNTGLPWASELPSTAANCEIGMEVSS